MKTCGGLCANSCGAVASATDRLHISLSRSPLRTQSFEQLSIAHGGFMMRYRGRHCFLLRNRRTTEHASTKRLWLDQRHCRSCEICVCTCLCRSTGRRWNDIFASSYLRSFLSTDSWMACHLQDAVLLCRLPALSRGDVGDLPLQGFPCRNQINAQLESNRQQNTKDSPLDSPDNQNDFYQRKPNLVLALLPWSPGKGHGGGLMHPTFCRDSPKPEPQSKLG